MFNTFNEDFKHMTADRLHITLGIKVNLENTVAIFEFEWVVNIFGLDLKVLTFAFSYLYFSYDIQPTI